MAPRALLALDGALGLTSAAHLLHPHLSPLGSHRLQKKTTTTKAVVIKIQVFVCLAHREGATL